MGGKVNTKNHYQIIDYKDREVLCLWVHCFATAFLYIGTILTLNTSLQFAVTVVWQTTDD